MAINWCLDVLLKILFWLHRTLTDEVAGVQESNTNMSINKGGHQQTKVSFFKCNTNLHTNQHYSVYIYWATGHCHHHSLCFESWLAVFNDMIRWVLDQEEEYDGDDREHDQGLGDDVVNLLLLVILLKYVRVSEKFVIGTAHTKVTFKIWK